MDIGRGAQENGDMCVCVYIIITDSQCYMAEANTTL